jgi:hypothetical protein
MIHCEISEMRPLARPADNGSGSVLSAAGMGLANETIEMNLRNDGYGGSHVLCSILQQEVSFPGTQVTVNSDHLVYTL